MIMATVTLVAFITLLPVLNILIKIPHPQVPKEPPLVSMCESPIERRLYRALRHSGHYPIPQVKCGPYRIDLTIPYTTPKIAIECDGHKFHSTPQQKAKDRAKDDYLRQNGFLVIRFKGWQINRSMGYVLNRIEQTVTSIKHHNL